MCKHGTDKSFDKSQGIKPGKAMFYFHKEEDEEEDTSSQGSNNDKINEGSTFTLCLKFKVCLKYYPVY